MTKYIGQQPVNGAYVKLDNITTSATNTYNLLNGSVAYSQSFKLHSQFKRSYTKSNSAYNIRISNNIYSKLRDIK